MYHWKRYPETGENHYEVTTRGDKRFSAFYARLKDGRTIEEAYQCDVKGYTTIKEGKGKPPKHRISRDMQWQAYLGLWEQWAAENPELIEELREKVAGGFRPLTDMFATSKINQARALSIILQNTENSLERFYNTK